jgi:hypothetical protein
MSEVCINSNEIRNGNKGNVSSNEKRLYRKIGMAGEKKKPQPVYLCVQTLPPAFRNNFGFDNIRNLI